MDYNKEIKKMRDDLVKVGCSNNEARYFAERAYSHWLKIIEGRDSQIYSVLRENKDPKKIGRASCRERV